MDLCNVFLSHPVFFVDIAIFICTPKLMRKVKRREKMRS